MTKPTNTNREEYAFNWYKEETPNPQNSDTDVAVRNKTLYAKWAQEDGLPCAVTFDVDGGSPAPAEQTVAQDKPAREPTKPSKAGYIFDGWYIGEGDETKWNFSADNVTQAITLKARWLEMVTVTFNTNGGSAIPSVSVTKGDSVYLSSYWTSKAGYAFDGWRTDPALSTPARNNLIVNVNTTLYARWVPRSALAPYVGVWRQIGRYSNSVYWLQADGTAWIFLSYGDFYKSVWSTSQVSGQELTFNDDERDSFTTNDGAITFTKSGGTKTPAAATGGLLGLWLSGSQTVKLKADATAVFANYGSSIVLKYCAEASAVYLLTPETNLVIFSININGGKLAGFSKAASDSSLAGVWKLTERGQDYYWNLNADGSGTFHTLGASVPVNFTITNDKRIDGNSYAILISGGTLTISVQTDWDANGPVYANISLTKVSGVSGSGAGGDPRLRGVWKAMRNGVGMTITLNADGTGSIDQVDYGSRSLIWKAAGGKFYMEYSDINSQRGGSGMSYKVSGSTFTLPGSEMEMAFTKE